MFNAKCPGKEESVKKKRAVGDMCIGNINRLICIKYFKCKIHVIREEM
jgi:hypothetical protein